MANNSPLLINLGQGLSMTLGLQTVTSWDSDTRPKDPKLGTFGFNSQTKSLEYWDGSAWYAAAMN